MLALHGPEPYASNRFGWPVQSCEQAVIDQLASAGEVVTPILVGFSQGAGLAGWMEWIGRVPARGVILVAPAMNIRGVTIPSSALKLIPSYIELGTDDWALGDKGLWKLAVRWLVAISRFFTRLCVWGCSSE